VQVADGGPGYCLMLLAGSAQAACYRVIEIKITLVTAKML
jgi:hypothetical protein